ncbi:MAG: GmrSD restriction endonuclease domain-containing protein [Clostridium sp.]|uniref:GmrSD restriction endonuclease domain-containing protein n=1 Tax=Clostridium sp. TaxID=1506 RepID=UPI003F369943
MKNLSGTVRKIMSYINNPIEQGGFWLPNIQRNFVWSEEQIIKLFDSIMRGYPIGTLMIWKTNQKVKFRRFVSEFNTGMSVISNYEAVNEEQKLLVLDGQQRLQSMYIALKGRYDKKELYINLLYEADEESEYKYDFIFLEEEKAKDGMVKVKDIVNCTKVREFSRKLIKDLKDKGILLDEDKKDLIEETVVEMNDVFSRQEIISYQELDSVDNEDIYKENDIVEIFIRANSGGTTLEKSDLLFALLTANIEEIEERLEELIKDLNSAGYNFTRDVVLKMCLCIIGAGAKYDVSKFRSNDNLKKIDENWDEISNAIKCVKDFIFEKTYLRCDKTLSAYTPLIPLVYLKYHYPKSFEEAMKNGLDIWLAKIMLAGVYSGSSDAIVDLTIKDIEENKGIDFESLKTVFKNKNRVLEITEDVILGLGYKTDNIKRKLYLVFNIWYKNFNFNPSFDGNKPNIDHIFPQSELKNVKIKGSKGRKVQRYRNDDINKIGNCMLLSFDENKSGAKGNKLPVEWFKDKDEKYLELHLIPKDKRLWEIENYEEFIEERNKLILEKIQKEINDK